MALWSSSTFVWDGGEEGTFRQLPSKPPVSGPFSPAGTPVDILAGTLTGTLWCSGRRAARRRDRLHACWLPQREGRRIVPAGRIRDGRGSPLDKADGSVVREAMSSWISQATDWTDTEVDLIVADYFDMLRLERAGGPEQASREIKVDYI